MKVQDWLNNKLLISNDIVDKYSRKITSVPFFIFLAVWALIQLFSARVYTCKIEFIHGFLVHTVSNLNWINEVIRNIYENLEMSKMQD